MRPAQEQTEQHVAARDIAPGKAELTSRKEINRQVWWAYPPQEGQAEADLVWGFVLTYSNGDIEWCDDSPTAEEIASRDACFIRCST